MSYWERYHLATTIISDTANTYTYDHLKRLSRVSNWLYNNDITYQNVGTSSTRTSALISEFDITNKSTSANLLSTSYGYNALGNITSFVSQAGTKATYTATYSYCSCMNNDFP